MRSRLFEFVGDPQAIWFTYSNNSIKLGVVTKEQSTGRYGDDLKIRHKNVSIKLQIDHINGMALDNIKHSAMPAPSTPLPQVTILAPLPSKPIQSFILRSFFNCLDSKTKESVKRRETGGRHLGFHPLAEPPCANWLSNL